MSAPRKLLLLGTVAALTTSCSQVLGDYTADLEAVEATREIESLCAVEEAVSTIPVDWEDDAQLADLPAYYAETNSRLLTHFDQVASAWNAGATTRSATYLMGPAGIGKSYLVDHLADVFAEDSRCEISLGDVIGVPPSAWGVTAVLTPDLATTDGSQVFNSLPDLEESALVAWAPLLEAAGCVVGGVPVPLIVVDGLDEVHDHAARALLAGLENWLIAENSPAAFAHVLVAGRPEGFHEWLTAPQRRDDVNALVTSFELTPPRFDTAGDLRFRLEGYLAYTEQLETVVANDEFEPWFSNLRSALQSHSFLANSMGNLAQGNMVLEQIGPSTRATEAELKDGLFDDLLQRNAKTHGRPSGTEALGATYRRLLEDAAGKYAPNADDGSFSVGSDDELEAFAADGQSLGFVRVRSLLNHSGLLLLTSPEAATPRYRFDPVWLHAYLFERHAHRTFPELAPVGCETVP